MLIKVLKREVDAVPIILLRATYSWDQSLKSVTSASKS